MARPSTKFTPKDSTPLLNHLHSAPPPPPEYQPLLQFRKDTVAHYLGVAPQYFYNILSGSKHPSKKLHNKIMELVKQIQSEMAVSESTLLDTVSGENGGRN